MRSSFTSMSGLKLVKSPSARDLTARRWLVAACAVGTFAIAGGVLGVVTAPRESGGSARTGPFSYFPSD